MTPPEPQSNHQTPFARDVLTLVQGTTIAQIVTILASPVITRLYGPDAFGLVALFTSIIGILGIAACLRYENAIVLPKSDVEAANVFGLCLFIVVFVSLATIPILIILQQPLVEFLKAPELGPFFWLIPPTLFVSGTSLAFNFWNTRTKQFYRLSIARVSSAFSTTGTQLGFGFLGLASGSVLIGTNILGHIVTAFILGIQIIRDHLSFFRQNISWKGMVGVFKRYSNFLKYDVWGAFINTISWQIPILLLSNFFSIKIVGYYSLGMMIITYPMSLIGSAIAQVFFQRAAAAKHEGSLSIIFEDTFSFLIKISMFPLLLLTFVGQSLFVFIFGSSWGEAGYYIQILSPWAVFFFIASPISSILSIEGKQKMGMVLSTFNLITRFLSIYIGGMLGSVTLSIFLFSLTGIAVYGFSGIYCMYLAGVKELKTLKIIFENFLVFLPAGILMVVLKIMQLSSIIEIIVAAILFFVFSLYLIKTDFTIRDILADYKLLKRE